MKDRQYYSDIYNSKWSQCLEQAKEECCESADITLEATEIFEETANSEEIIGYYVVLHGDSALKDWLNNTEGLKFTEQDKEIDRELKRLFKRSNDI